MKLVKTDFEESSVIFYELREFPVKETKAQIEHDRSHIKSFISKLLPETVAEVNIYKL